MSQLLQSAEEQGMSKKEFRGYVPPDLNRLIRAIVGLKNGNKDWSLSDILTEALQDWVNKPENQELIKRHNLKGLDEKE